MKTPPFHSAIVIRLAKTAFAAVLLLATSHHAQAANGTWKNATSGTNSWQVNGNWTGATFPNATAAEATFGSLGSGTVDLGGTISLTRLFFGINAGDSGAFTIGVSGNTLNLGATSGTSIGVTGGVTANETVAASINMASGAGTPTAIGAGFINNGAGLLTISGNVTSKETNAAGSSILTIGGVGNGLLSGVLSGGGAAGSAGLKVQKYGSGTWTLSGANTYTGTTSAYGGTLVLDYSGTNAPVATSPVEIVGGVAVFKGKSSGTTSVTIGSLALNQSTGLTANTLTLDANGGSGVNLTISTLTQSQTGAVSQLIDLSNNAGNSVTVTTLDTKFALQNGVLETAVGSGQYRANTILKDSTGYGFATIATTTGGAITRYTGATTLDTTAGSDATNYQLKYSDTTAGTFTHTGNDLKYNTLTIDSSGGAITLDMGAKNIAPGTNSSGRGILVTGSNNVQINGTGSLSGSANQNTYLYNYGTGDLSIQLGSTATFLSAGTGFTNLSGIFTIPSGAMFQVAGGIARLSSAQNLSAAVGNIQVSGGVLEIGADLNGVTGGDFTNAVGTTANSGQIRFIGDSGLSASGANRVVNFGGASAQLTWGSTGFLTTAGSSDGGYTLLLSSAKSDATLEIQNPIALGNGAGGNLDRVVSVANGTAATDAILSGVLSGPAANLIKTGAGTLALAAANTYAGGTIVNAGTLVLSASGSIANSPTIKVAGSATFTNNSGSPLTKAFTLTEGAKLDGTAGYANSGTTVLADLSNGFSSIALGTFDKTGSLNFLFTNISSGTYSSIFSGSFSGSFTSVSIDGTALSGTGGVFTGTVGGVDYQFTDSSSQLIVTVPEPATWALLAFSLTTVVVLRRRQQG